jgi:hypothetical protein
MHEAAGGNSPGDRWYTSVNHYDMSDGDGAKLRDALARSYVSENA